MAVPAHDERDYEFAEKYQIEIRRVIAHPDGDEDKGKLPYSGPGHMVNSENTMEWRLMPANRKSFPTSRQRLWAREQSTISYATGYFRASVTGVNPFLWSGSATMTSKKPYLVKACSKTCYPKNPSPQIRTVKPFMPSPSRLRIALKTPEVENYQPAGTGESPLATITDWLDIWFNLKTGKSVSAWKLNRMVITGYPLPARPIPCPSGRFLLVSLTVPGPN